MTLTDPKLILTFLENDLAPGHSTTQTLGDTELVRHTFTFKRQRFNGLKSSSDTVSFQLVRRCSATEDIIATEGDIKAVLQDGDTVLFTGFVSTNFSWAVTDHGEQVLNISLESVGTRLFNKAFIETGKYFFDCTASAAVYNIINPLGISLREGDERKLLQNVKKCVEGGTTCRDLMDQLCYECNAVYFFNNVGELCIQEITADTTGVPVYDSSKLRMKDKKVVNLSKKLRTYKGARVAYDEVSSAQGYLIYRNTTNASATRVCNIELPGGNYFDGAEIYTAQEWSEATADEFREPTLISAVNAASESSIVGSNEILNISNLTPSVVKDADIDFSAEIVGGPYFKLLAHNTALTTKAITRMDLYADIVYVKSHGVIRTQIDGASEGKSTLEEELSWIHDRENASRHANLLAQYHRSAGATYTFYCNEDITLGSVIKLNDDVYSGLEVYVLVTASQNNDRDESFTYTAVGISTFDLGEDAYHGTTEPAKQSGAQGPQGEPGATAEVQYAIGTSFIVPPGDAMQWNSVDMLWDGDTMLWNTGTWEEGVPEPVRGQYIWMRMRVGDAPWQYTRLTGATAWDPSFLGLYDSTTGAPTQTPDGLNLVVGDCFTALETWSTFTKGITYTYTGSGWTPAGTDRPKILLEALNAMKEAGVDFKGLNDPNTVSWFNTIVADTVVANTLKAVEGFFDNITIAGVSRFEGQIQNDAITTFPASSPDTISGSLNGTAEQKPQYYYYGFVSEANMVAVMGSSNTSAKATGTVTLTDNTVFTGTEANPFLLNYVPGRFISISGGNISYVNSTGQTKTSLEMTYYTSPDGYYGIDSIISFTPPTILSLKSVSLAIPTSLGGFYSHDILPKGTSDKIGSSTEPFSALWLGDSKIEQGAGESVLPNGLKIKWGRKQIPASAGSGYINITFTTEGLTNFSLWCLPFVSYANNSSGSVGTAQVYYTSTNVISFYYSVPSSSYNWLDWFAIGV